MTTSDNDKSIKEDLGEGQLEGQGGWDLTAKDLLVEVRDIADGHWAKVMRDAAINESTYHGMDTYTDDLEELAESGRSKKNILRTLIGGFASSVIEGQPENNAFPTAADAEAIKRSELANKFLKWWRHRMRFDVQNHELVEQGQLGGTAAYKVFWDTRLGSEMWEDEVDEDGDVVTDDEGTVQKRFLGNTGEVNCEVVTMFDFAFGPGHDVTKATWALHRRYIMRDEAIQLLVENGLDPVALPEEESFVDVNGREMSGFVAWELWYRPGFRFPKGKFVLALNDDILADDDYPYAHGRLPFAVWSPQPVRDSCFGTSHVFDNIHTQRALNKVELMKDMLVEEFGGVILTMPRDLADQRRDGNVVIEIDQGREADLIQWKMLPGMPPLLAQRSQELEAAMFDQAGQNEILSGHSDIKAGTSARSYELLGRADAKKLAGVIARYRECLYVRDWLALSCFQEKAKVEQKVMVVGEDEEPFIDMLTGADVEGAEVMLLPVPAIENAPQAKASGAAERAQAGMVNPGDVPELSRTGLDTTLMGDQQLDLLRDTFMQALQDNRQDLQPPTNVDPVQALQELAKLAALNGVNINKLNEWKAFYQNMLMQQQQQIQQQGGPQ